MILYINSVYHKNLTGDSERHAPQNVNVKVEAPVVGADFDNVLIFFIINCLC
jgi:hypothetical protein